VPCRHESAENCSLVVLVIMHRSACAPVHHCLSSKQKCFPWWEHTCGRECMKHSAELRATALSTGEVAGKLGAAFAPSDGGAGAGTDRTPGEEPIARRKPKGG